jgi:hypothetical protein
LDWKEVVEVLRAVEGDVGVSLMMMVVMKRIEVHSMMHVPDRANASLKMKE